MGEDLDNDLYSGSVFKSKLDESAGVGIVAA
jgi:hypothetical protein